jgi:hypothetical protein
MSSRKIERLRRAILTAGVELTERVKWNAPSFCAGGDDRITFRLQPGDRIELVLHRGARKRTDTDTFEFADPTGSVRWITPDRGVVAFTDAADTESRITEVVVLVEAWIAATSDR